MRGLSWYTLVLGTLAAVGCGSDTPAEPLAAPGPLSVEPSFVTVGIGKSVKLAASLARGAGAAMQASEIVWRSANDTIASITATGMVRGVHVGRTRVVATWHGNQGSALVTVIDPGKPKRPVCSTVGGRKGSTRCQ